MKRLMIILSIAAFSFAIKSEAQGIFYTSYGTQHLWGMPPEVQWTLERNYYDFHMVHTRRFWDRGRLYFDVVLQRGGVFVDVRLDGRGFIFNTAYRDYYPFRSHVCSSFCGFHRDYYMSYRVRVGHPYYYRYNHVYYRPNVVIVNHGHHHGNHHGHNQGNNHANYKKGPERYKPTPAERYRVDRTDNGRIERVNHGPSRDSGRNPDYGRGNGGSKGNNGVRDHGAGVGRGNGNGVGNGNKGNNGVRDHGVGVGRGSGQGKGQGNGPGVNKGNSGRVYTASNSRSASSGRVSSSSSSRSRTSVSSSSGRTSRSSNSSSSGRTTSGRTVRTR